jgi:ABC-type nitrate/sulfonate/bicarbonate transport system substrate-binding protein
MTSILPGPALRALGAVLLLALGFPVLAATPVTLQLKWTHNFQFAGYYAALEKGYYRDAGLEVRIEEARPGLDVVGQVVSGRADFGVGNSALLLDRHAGRPVVVLATIFQHSPAVYIARRQSAAQSVHDLAGQRVMVEPAMAELTAYLRREGIADDRLTVVEHSFNPRDLIDGKVDAMSAYLSYEPYFLDQAGVDYQIFTPARWVSISMATTCSPPSLLKARPDLARAFRRASLRGWEYAMAHPGEIATLIHERYAPAVRGISSSSPPARCSR